MRRKQFDLTLDEVLDLVDDWKNSGEGYSAICPSHDDNRHSLSVNEDEGKLLLRCHKGCEFEHVIEDLKKRRTDNRKKTKRKTTAPKIYNYCDPRGKILYRKHRLPNKSFFFEHKKKSADWQNGMGGQKSVLYRLQKVMKAIRNKEDVYFVEGEKDVHALEKFGLVATTSGSASSWKPRFTQGLEGLGRAVIIPDNDKPGRKYAEQIAESLQDVAGELKVLNLPGLEEREDVSDWIDYGGTKTELKRLVEETPLWQPGAVEADHEFQHTDAGNAKRLIAANRDVMGYCRPWKTWIAWDGKRWITDAEPYIYALADKLIKEMCAQASNLSDSGKRKELMKHAVTVQSKQRIEAMVALAKMSLDIAVDPKDFDNKPWLLNVSNGTLDLRTGRLREFRKEDKLTKMISVEYDPKAKCPKWMKFLDDVTGGDPELTKYLQKISGYVLTGKVSEHQLFFCYGIGRNGKSTFLNVLQGVLEDYAYKTSADFLLKKPGGTHTTELTEARGRRLIVTIEIEEKKDISPSLLKELTGGDKLTARRMHQNNSSWNPTAKVILAANHKPEVTDTTLGFWSRINVIPFETVFRGKKKIKDFHEIMLAEEKPGILNWMIEGCLLWQKEDLNPPEKVRVASNLYQEETDTLEKFIKERCLVGKTLSAPKPVLYNQYVLWCRWNEMNSLPKKTFNTKMREKGFRDPKKFFIVGQSDKPGWNGKPGWKGITLKPLKKTAKKVDRLKRLKS